MKELFENDDYCFDQISEARELFSNRSTTKKQFKAMEDVLGFIYMWGSEKVSKYALLTLDESQKRKFYFITSFWI